MQPCFLSSSCITAQENQSESDSCQNSHSNVNDAQHKLVSCSNLVVWRSCWLVSLDGAHTNWAVTSNRMEGRGNCIFRYSWINPFQSFFVQNTKLLSACMHRLQRFELRRTYTVSEWVWVWTGLWYLMILLSKIVMTSVQWLLKKWVGHYRQKHCFFSHWSILGFCMSSYILVKRKHPKYACINYSCL